MAADKSRIRWWLPRLAAGAAVALIVSQLVPVPRDNPGVTADVGAPPPAAALLRRACYDCHSNETIWPWYSAIAPISWLVAWDVREGRRELNFSTWTAYDPPRRRKKLKESIEELREGEMPPWTYLAAHAEARLAPAERDALLAWLVAESGQ